MTITRRLIAGLALLTVAACGSDKTTAPPPGFLHGQVGFVVNALSHSVTLFQLASPAMKEQIALGASNTITPVGMSVQGKTAIVPLGDAASVADIDLTHVSATPKFFLFPSGNATGQAFIDDTTVLANNATDGVVGRFTLGQSSTNISNTVGVAPQPTDIVVSGTRAYIISANLDQNFAPIGNGIVTALDTKTLHVLGTVSTTGIDASAGAMGPDGKLYVVNTGDFVDPGSVTVIDPASLTVVDSIPNAGVGPTAIAIDNGGLLYISDFSTGTLVYNTSTRAYVRGPNNPVCALNAQQACRGAADTRTDANGNVYQVYFGATGDPGQIFIYAPGTYTLKDSVTAGDGPISLRIASY